MDTQPIAEFSILGLHEERDVRIIFDGPVKILVAENGVGKTTILNALHALVSGNLAKLRTISFREISLKFKSGRSVSLKKEHFSLDFDRASSTGIFQHLKSSLSLEQIQQLYEGFKSSPRNVFRRSSLFQITRKKMGSVPEDAFYQWIEMFAREIGGANLQSEALTQALSVIREEFPYEIIYLPTYRRIEEDLQNISPSGIEIPVDQNVIQFGMHDVRARFEEITSEIKNSSIEWFAKVNGQMLGQLIEGFRIDDSMRASLRDPEALRIVLDRVGENMPTANKELILGLIQTEDIFINHDPLAYFLANLVKVYEQQKDNDNAIKRFTDISNRYLVDKKVVYNESAVDIFIVRKKNEHKVEINTLSSGEKQIISLFSRLFLGKLKNVAIFFDEPELSLSIEWQKQLLPHIIQSGICKFLFCTTHSPFVFENELDKYTSGLDQYVTEL